MKNNLTKETILTRKEEIIAALIGVVIGGVIGAIMSASYIREGKRYEALKEENQMLKEIVWQQESYIEQQAFQK
jgi:hypothetical protein